MTQSRAVLSLICIFCAATALANDELSDAVETVRKEAQACKTSPSQEIAFELRTVPGKPASEPATPAEQARVKEILEKSAMPFDPVNHRATYEFTLALVRAKNIAVFKLSPADTVNISSVHECLTKLASDIGLEPKFE